MILTFNSNYGSILHRYEIFDYDMHSLLLAVESPCQDCHCQPILSAVW